MELKELDEFLLARQLDESGRQACAPNLSRYTCDGFRCHPSRRERVCLAAGRMAVPSQSRGVPGECRPPI